MESGSTWVQIPSAIVTLVIGMILVLAGIWIGQSFNLLPVDASANAPIYDELFRFCSRLEPSCSSGLSDFLCSA